MKLLSPAGNFESLKMAVFNGADEVYLGVNDFNARNNIDGFTIETLKSAVDFAHVFSVKVLLAVNILFSDDELQSALDLVIDGYNAGVDAFIIQDIGLMKLLSERYKEIELHASTQMGLHNLEGVLEVQKYGVKRVVLARETPLSEIKRIKENTDVEIEYFVQGALCISFSGNCYMSSYLFGASGNRGKCKQPCRLPYTLLKDKKKIKRGYLLSAKDFNLSARLKELKEVGVDVLKIEGRARRPFYVATATREYYKALHGKAFDNDAIKLAFNRNYTEGYFNGNGKIISDIQSHIGVFVGKVDKVVSGKTFNEVFLSSSLELSPKSTFKLFLNNVEKSTLTAFDLKKVGTNKYRLTTTQPVSTGEEIRLIVDAKKEDETLKISKKRAVDISLYLESGKNISAIICVLGKEEKVFGEILSDAKNQPITAEELEKNFSKHELLSGNINVARLDKVFITKTALNEFRRKVFECAYGALTRLDRKVLAKTKVEEKTTKSTFTDFCIIEDLDGELTAKNVVYSPEIYQFEDVIKLKNRCEGLGKTLYLDTPNFALEKDILFIKDIINQTGVGIIANNYYALSISEKVVIGAGLNIYNNYSARVFNKPFFTAESEISKAIKFPYMTLKHCPIKSHVGGDCSSCKYSDGYEYLMESGKNFKLKRKKLSDCTFYLVD